MNLSVQFQNGLLSPWLRRFFYWILGTKAGTGKGFFSISGLFHDPFMIELGSGSVVCHDAMITCHALTPEALILSKVRIMDGAVVGARVLLMPGVTVGKGARVEDLSLVTMGTQIGDHEVWQGIPARKVGVTEPEGCFQTNVIDYLYTTLIEVFIWTLAGLGMWLSSSLWWGDGFAALLLFHVFDVILTLTVLAIFRKFFPFGPGTFDQKEYPHIVRRWRLYEFLCVKNCSLYYFNGFIPPHLRKIFLRLLGLKTHISDFLSNGWIVLGPHFVTVGRNTIIGLDAVISAISVTSEKLILEPIAIGNGVMIGMRSVISPGVMIGEGAAIEPMSYVSRGTVIPPYEIWSGVPAKKVGDVRPGQSPWTQNK